MARSFIADKKCICRVCNAEFLAKYRGTSYCSVECRHAEELKAWHTRRAGKGMPTLGYVKCTRCDVDIPGAIGRQKYCAECRKTVNKEKQARHYAKHPQRIKDRQKAFDLKRRDDPARRESVRRSSKKRDDAWRSTPKGNLDHRMSQLVRYSLTSEKKRGRKWESLVGYSISDLLEHIQRQFCKGMSWENMSEWHIDHIVPKSSFNYTSPEDDEFKACWAMSNLRPLWSEENLRKGAKRHHLI